MSRMRDVHLPEPVSRLGPKVRQRRWSILPEADHRQLKLHLQLCDNTGEPASALLAHVLLHKITTTRPVKTVTASDLVTGGCRVLYSVDGGPAQSGLVDHGAGSRPVSSAISVGSLLGATLIGMRIGQRAPLLREDGSIGTISVAGVARPV